MFKIFSRLEFPSYILQTSNVEHPLVLKFQKLLNCKGAKYNVSVKETGKYDTNTREAVSAYQLHALGIVNSDGFVGPQTAKKLRIRLIDEETEVTSLL